MWAYWESGMTLDDLVHLVRWTFTIMCVRNLLANEERKNECVVRGLSKANLLVVSTTTTATTIFICQNDRKPERAKAHQSWLHKGNTN